MRSNPFPSGTGGIRPRVVWGLALALLVPTAPTRALWVGRPRVETVDLGGAGRVLCNNSVGALLHTVECDYCSPRGSRTPSGRSVV